MKARTSASGRVFRTCRASTHPRRAVMTPEMHLARQHVRAVAVAVDGDGRSRGDRPPGERAVHVEVRGRAVDFEQRAGLDGRFEQAGRNRDRTRAGAARAGSSGA